MQIHDETQDQSVFEIDTVSYLATPLGLPGSDAVPFGCGAANGEWTHGPSAPAVRRSRGLCVAVRNEMK